MSIDHNFKHHPPRTPEVVAAHEAVRGAAREFALVISKFCHEGREKSLAITKTEEALMWANASIARSQ